MGNKIERAQNLEAFGIKSLKYLFFGDELHVGVNKHEEHIDILGASGRRKEEVLVAGGISTLDDDIVVDGYGSLSLKIEQRDPAPVTEFIKSLPDIDTKRVMAV